MLPEERARKKIDHQLQTAGWDIVSRDEYIPNSASAVKEALMQGNTESDYLFFIDHKAIVQGQIQWDKFIEISEAISRMFINDFSLLEKVERNSPLEIFTNETNYYEYQRLEGLGLLDDSKPRWELYQALKSISEQWLLNDFLEWWIAYCSEKWDYEQAERRIQMKKYLQSNVNQDSVLLYGLMK